MDVKAVRPENLNGGLGKGGAMTARSKPVDDYMKARAEPVRAVLEALEDLVLSAFPEVDLGMKWGAPVFLTKTGVPFAYLYGGKDHANLGFLRGAELDDPDKLLEGRGKSGRHIKVFAAADIRPEAYLHLLGQALNLDPE